MTDVRARPAGPSATAPPATSARRPRSRDALGVRRAVVRIRVREPWDAFAPRLVTRRTCGDSRRRRQRARRAVARHRDRLRPPRRARHARVARLERGPPFTVQILDPRIDTHAFDVVIAPQHDRVDGENVIRSIGALNPVDPRWLAAARARSRVADSAAPRTAVLIGATNRRATARRCVFRCAARSARRAARSRRRQLPRQRVAAHAGEIVARLRARVRSISRRVLGGDRRRRKSVRRIARAGPIASSSRPIRST